jgi:hypothetical protein
MGAVARRANPDRIFTARRAAVRKRLMAEGMTEQTAEAWVDAWEREVDARRIDRQNPDYWKDPAPVDRGAAEDEEDAGLEHLHRRYVGQLGNRRSAMWRPRRAPSTLPAAPVVPP